MVEIRYGDQYEVTNLAGQTISEAREQFRSEFGIPDKARARLNGGKVKASAESDTVLNDDDKLSFAASKSRTPFLIGALLLALAVTGGVFAYGFTTTSVTINASTTGYDFASVTGNFSDLPTWTTYGKFRGAISGPKPIFDINTSNSTYTGDLTITVSLANADQLSTVYRVLALKLTLKESDDGTTLVDINEDSANNSADFVLLTLSNGSVDMYPDGTAGSMTIFVESGFYISNIVGGGWTSGYEDPQLFAEVAQRGT